MFDALRETILESPETYVSVGGFIIGLIFGFIGLSNQFLHDGFDIGHPVVR